MGGNRLLVTVSFRREERIKFDLGLFRFVEFL
jgi:hypothetical protein